jgi:hypothetical protein
MVILVVHFEPVPQIIIQYSQKKAEAIVPVEDGRARLRALDEGMKSL